MNIHKAILTLVCTIVVVFFTGQAVQAAAPLNDNCANAELVGNVTNKYFSTIDATYDGPAVAGRCLYSPDIWYCYTAACNGEVTVSLNGSSYDTKMAVYDGAECPATIARMIDCNDDYFGLYSRCVFEATCGKQYLIQVGGYQTYTGLGKLTITCDGAICGSESNDDCENADAIGNVINLAFDTTDATNDGPDEHITGPNIWYRYTATCSGDLTISLCGSSYDTALAVYAGHDCGNIDEPLKYNDDSCSSQSEITLMGVAAGNKYLIEIGGYQNSAGQGILNIICEGEPAEEGPDLGDAPDRTNNLGYNMTTYGNLTPANFPTVFDDGTGLPPYGPKHESPLSVAHLGDGVTAEDEADSGWDQDPHNNINPPSYNNRDQMDDGVTTPLNMPHCRLTTFDYLVNVITPGTDLYVNVWFDFNRDGDWNDDDITDPDLLCTSCSGAPVNEWAVQNQLLFNLPVGLHQISTPGFLSWHSPTKPAAVWMRITLSEEPWKGGSGAGGSGPETGYLYGETEDYYFTPEQECSICEDYTNDGLIDYDDLIAYIVLWLDECND
jgi:hypothetical protein